MSEALVPKISEEMRARFEQAAKDRQPVVVDETGQKWLRMPYSGGYMMSHERPPEKPLHYTHR